MEVVQTRGAVHESPGDGIRMTETKKVTETLERITACLDSRERRKSKYLSYPYVNFGPGLKEVPADMEDLKNSFPSHKVESSSIATDNINGSPSITKSVSKRFQRSWYRKFISQLTLSSSPEFENTSSAELLSGLNSKAVDCMFSIENKSFDLVEWFFCRYRISKFHDEAEFAAYLVNGKGRSTNPLKNDSLNIKIEQKRRKKKKPENAVKHKTKSLSGLLDVNANIDTSETLLKDFLAGCSRKPSGKLKQNRNMEEDVNPLLQSQTDALRNLNGSDEKCNSVPECSLLLSCLASEAKANRKRRKKKVADSELPTSQVALGMLDGDEKITKCNSLVIDLQLMSAQAHGGISENCNGENKKSLGLSGSHPKFPDSQPGFVKSGANLELLNFTSHVGVPSVHNTVQKRRKWKEVEQLKTNLVMEIPDLNGTNTEFSSTVKELEDDNGLFSELKSKRNKKRNKREPVLSEQSRGLSSCIGPAKTITCNGVDANGELGTCLLLQFAPGFTLPSKEDLLETFRQFGPLKESDTQLINNIGTAQVVFVKTADAGEAFRSIELNKPFGANLIDYKTYHLSATCPLVKGCMTPVQPGFKPIEGCMTTAQLSGFKEGCMTAAQSSGFKEGCLTAAQPSALKSPRTVAPPLDFIRHNLQMMTLMLENSGNNLSPAMRAKLEEEIKNLLIKVNSMPSSCSPKI